MDNNLKKCPKCGCEIARIATRCPNCNYNFIAEQSVAKTKIPQARIGIVGMIFGILALLLSCTTIGAPLAIFGFIFSVVGLTKKYYAHGTAVAGLTTSIIAIILALIMVINLKDVDKDKSNEHIAEKTEISKSKNPDEQQKVKTNPSQKPSKKKTEAEKKKKYVKSCTSYNYKDVLRNPDKYIGNRVKEKLKISSVHEKSWLNSTKYYFAYSNDEYDLWTGNEYVIFDKRKKQSPKLLEDDIIEVYGEIAEPEDTVSLIVNSSEVFAIDMKYVKLIEE